MFYTYLHCKPDGTPFYVGKGADRTYEGHGTDRRSHSKKNRSKHHRNITAKYGWENILVYVFPCESEAQALADEIQQIAQLRREGYKLCNITAGGEGCSGLVVTAETRLKIAAALKGKKRGPHSEAHKRALSAANKGKIPSEAACKASSERLLGKPAWNKGRQWSPEILEKMAAAKRGKKYSAETKAKVSAAVTEIWRKRKQSI